MKLSAVTPLARGWLYAEAVILAVLAVLYGGGFAVWYQVVGVLLLISSALAIRGGAALVMGGSALALLHSPALVAGFYAPAYSFLMCVLVLALLAVADLAARRRWSWGLLLAATVPCIGVAVLLGGYEGALRAPMPYDSLLPLIETNGGEALSFLARTPSLIAAVSVLPVLVALGWMARRKGAALPALAPEARLVAVIAVLMALIANPMAQRIASAITILGNYDQRALAYHDALPQRLARLPQLGMKRVRASAPQLTVVVVGESANRHHLGLYGYARATTPVLSAVPAAQLLVYRDVISSAITTHHSLTRALTTATLASGKTYDDAEMVSVFELLRSAGLYTSWISNQMPHGLWGQAITDIADHANTTHYARNDTRDSRTSRLFDDTESLTAPFDEVLLPLLDKEIAAAPRPAVLFVHIMGSHFKAADRYPAAFDRFKGGTVAIDAYDNSVLYTDWLLGQIIARLQRSGAPASLLYFSDHSESVEDYVPRDPAAFRRVQAEVPFALWVSPAVAKADASFVARAKAGADRPFMLDSLTQAILDLAGVEGPFFHPQGSLFDPAFTPRPRWTNEGRVLYDAK